eukprot:TRINITY_DN1523_c0_g1_i1.p1 TRINITY_DN1523_c0_g1~~TRINITY_DN1523_c0_g1_i1.p1  ORF type:complete len:825 (+),score=149.93 TRINITY_DN1523_c0_g1_i1:43-2475(+)
MGNEPSSPDRRKPNDVTVERQKSRADMRSVSARDIEQLDDRMKAKFQKGVKYNLKVVIRGAPGVGKTQLLRRLQGRAFEPLYTRSSRISAATINWRYEDSEEVVKVEVWDIVDKGFVESTSGVDSLRKKALSFFGSKAPMEESEMIADATTVDVYRGTHAAVFVVDITKRESLQYVLEEIPNVPRNCHILVLCNFFDCHEQRAVTEQDIRELVQTRAGRKRQSALTDGRIYTLNTSMKNDFGLSELYKYLNLPFLNLKVAVLQETVQRIYDEIGRCDEAFSRMSDGQDYDSHLEMLTALQQGSQKKSGPEANLQTSDYSPLPDEEPVPVEPVAPSTKGSSSETKPATGSTNRSPSVLKTEKEEALQPKPVTNLILSNIPQSMDDFYADGDNAEEEPKSSSESESEAEENSQLARPLDDPSMYNSSPKWNHRTSKAPQNNVAPDRRTDQNRQKGKPIVTRSESPPVAPLPAPLESEPKPEPDLIEKAPNWSDNFDEQQRKLTEAAAALVEAGGLDDFLAGGDDPVEEQDTVDFSPNASPKTGFQLPPAVDDFVPAGTGFLDDHGDDFVPPNSSFNRSFVQDFLDSPQRMVRNESIGNWNIEEEQAPAPVTSQGPRSPAFTDTPVVLTFKPLAVPPKQVAKTATVSTAAQLALKQIEEEMARMAEEAQRAREAEVAQQPDELMTMQKQIERERKERKKEQKRKEKEAGESKHEKKEKRHKEKDRDRDKVQYEDPDHDRYRETSEENGYGPVSDAHERRNRDRDRKDPEDRERKERRDRDRDRDREKQKDRDRPRDNKDRERTSRSERSRSGV